MKLFKNTRQQLQDVKQKFSDVTTHVKEHKEAYLTGAACFVGGVLLAKKSVRVETNVTVVNLPNPIDTKQIFEQHYPLSAARTRAIKESLTSS
jgi:hypothetical protein